MRRLHLVVCCFALVLVGCRQEEQSTAAQAATISQKRAVFDGKLQEWQRAVSIVPAPGWIQRKSDVFLSVVHSNGNVLNISPAHGPVVSGYDVVKYVRDWVTRGRNLGSDVWDYREFMAGALPGAYAIHIAGKKYQEPQGDILGEVGGEWRIGFSGAFHPGDTNMNAVTEMLKTLRVESGSEPEHPRNL